MEITCAYDPNDKQVFPAGFTDDHLILNDTELEYLVRFQNTGNAVAQDVLLRDTLDANLDLSTFQLMANSHSVLTTLDANTREVTFLFQGIQLPDSTCCEEDSHGLVSYIIRPYPDLEVATEINNTAYIYFDNNPPIVTNTTWSTIHACSPGLAVTDTIIEDCPGNAVEITSNYDQSIAWASTYEWTVEDELVGSEASLVLSPNYEVEGEVFLTVTNPLCKEYGTQDFEFTEGFDWTSCVGDLDCDHAIGSTDVVLFLGEFGCSGVACRFDLNGDGIADSSDLLVVIGAFGTVCSE